jgi:bacterioferritin-associated ferredoxin
MFVCVCHAVPESEVHASIAAGATTREDVTRACRAGGDCGACHGMIEDMLEAADEVAGGASHARPQLIATARLVQKPTRERAA